MKVRMTFSEAQEWLNWTISLDQKYYRERFYMYVLMRMSFDDDGVWLDLPDGPPQRTPTTH